MFSYRPGEKEDGTIHFCVDYHKLDDATHKDAHPLPRIDDILEAFQRVKYGKTFKETLTNLKLVLGLLPQYNLFAQA